MATRETKDGHVHAQVDDYLDGRLGSEAEVAFEAHLLVCDACFSEYLLHTVDVI